MNKEILHHKLHVDYSGLGRFYVEPQLRWYLFIIFIVSRTPGINKVDPLCINGSLANLIMIVNKIVILCCSICSTLPVSCLGQETRKGVSNIEFSKLCLTEQQGQSFNLYLVHLVKNVPSQGSSIVCGF